MGGEPPNAVITGLKTRRKPLREQRTDRHARGQALGEHHCIRTNPSALKREPCTGAPDTGLHLVKEQQRIVLVAQRSCLLKERLIDHVHAALALNRLDEDARRLRTDRCAQCLDVVAGNMTKAGGERFEGNLLWLSPRRLERAESTAMKGTFETDQLVFVGAPGLGPVSARKLDRSLVRLGA